MAPRYIGWSAGSGSAALNVLGERGRHQPQVKFDDMRPEESFVAGALVNLYTKVLAKYVTSGALSLKLEINVAPSAGLSPQQLEDVRAALRELGLNDRLE